MAGDKLEEKEMRGELLAHLDGLREGMPLAFWRLAEIFQYQVFEICKEPSEKEEAGRQNYLIPYMMNDAIEDYLILENCRIVGEAATEEQMGELELSARISGEEGNYVLVVRQRSLSYGEENVFTLYFETLRECRTCYQYHAIGHFWMEGQEQWRRLVYMAGTIYDKFAYVGEEVCTEGELMLLRLAEFAPFRNWSPVRESLEEKYPATYEGIDCMEQFALRAEDKAYLRLLWLYRRVPSRFLERCLTKALRSPKRERLYETILWAIEAESGTYEKRDYGAVFQKEIEEKRKRAEEKLIQSGFVGTYPDYQNGEFTVTVVEEHPFTVMEWEHFQFRIYYMVSQVKRKGISGRRKENSLRQKKEGEGDGCDWLRNQGFFHGKGRKSWIFTEDGENVADRIRKKR